MPRKFDFLSPGIQITEVDQSILPADVDADGPIIIGRTRKGPAMKPVKVRSLDDFVAVFGTPNPGGVQSDMWRAGAGASAPTYASYAAQSWLAGGTSPVTMVRLLGEQSSNASTDAGKAGWKLGSTTSGLTSDNKDNATAYGLFITERAKSGVATAITLAAASSFNASNLETNSSKLMFFRNNDVTTATKAAGLVLEIDFETDSSVIAANAVARALDGSDSVAKITCGISGLSTITEILAVVETALVEAVSQGDISQIAIDNLGSTLKIFNLRPNSVPAAVTDQLTVTDSGTAVSHFKAIGVDPQNPSINETGTELNSASNAQAVSAVASTIEPATGALAAVFYATGSLALTSSQGTFDGSALTAPKTNALIKSQGTNEFGLAVINNSGTTTETITFNFDRNSENYIRNVLNTNPTLVNSDMVASPKTYWLGESFERHLLTHVTSSGAGEQFGILIPLHQQDQSTDDYNWSYRKEGAQYAKTGYVISQDYGTAANYDGTQANQLFRFCSLQEGEQLQKEIIICIEELALPTNPVVNGYSSFTIAIKDLNGTVLEKYSNLNLDENSSDYIARRIGDMYMEWDDTNRRYYSYGDYQNVSDYIRVEMGTNPLKNGLDAVPFGFLGPGRPKGFGILEGDSQPKSLDLSDDFTTALVKDGDPNSAASSEFAELFGIEAVKFVFPSIPLRASGGDGFAPNPYKATFGIRPKVHTSSSAHDTDYVDYIRRPSSQYASKIFEPSANFEYSFAFTLDDIVVDTSANTVTYTSGSRQDGTSRTATNSVSDLINKGVKQFAMPLFGGFDGLDVLEKEPFRRALVDSAASATDSTDDITYTLNKAIDSVEDEEHIRGNLLLMPGFRNENFTSKLISTAESRGDTLAIIDLENDYRPAVEEQDSETATNRRGSVVSAISSIKARNLDSSFGCAFYPWIQVRDTLNNSELIWMPPSIAALGAMARTESSSELWFAPAGFNRGGLGALGGSSGPVAVQARQRLDSSDRDDLYVVNINPIATFPNEGLVIFGQKTLQAVPSALDRINVRRLLLYLKRKIGDVAKNTLFQNNVPATWADFKGKAEPILLDVKNKFGLTEYRIVLDETTTTPDLVDRNILYAKIFLKPARAIEFIAIDFVITKSGAEFV